MTRSGLPTDDTPLFADSTHASQLNPNARPFYPTGTENDSHPTECGPDLLVDEAGNEYTRPMAVQGHNSDVEPHTREQPPSSLVVTMT